MTAWQIADDLLADLAPFDVTAAETLGLQPESLLPKLAPADFAARHAAMARALARLTADSGGSSGSQPDNQPLLAAVLRERLASDLALDDAGFTTALLAPLATPVHAIREVFDTLPYDAVAQHLAQVPGALRDYAQTLREAPRVAAARQVRGAADQCSKWVDVQHDDFYRRLVAPRPALHPWAQAASDATLEFADFLRSELLPRAPERDAVGRELYGVTSRAFLGDDVDVDDTYAFGWDELAELTAEMTSVSRELGADSIGEAAAALDADRSRVLTSADELAGWLQRRVDEVVDATDGVHLDLPVQARRPEAAISPTAVGIMYYSPPAPDLSRPGRIWWSQPAGGRTSTWHEVTTVHHEGVPGHHLQIATALAEPGMHPYQRTMVHVHGYAEGWAHYAERLADEFGLLRDPGERLGMLFGQRWRAARIVIDMGLHLQLPIPRGNGFTDAATWTPAVGRDVLAKAARCDAATARFEVDRYLGWPGQALSFRVGARLWRQARAVAQQRPGFDLRGFHMRALRMGPMGLRPLREALS